MLAPEAAQTEHPWCRWTRAGLAGTVLKAPRLPSDPQTGAQKQAEAFSASYRAGEGIGRLHVNVRRPGKKLRLSSASSNVIAAGGFKQDWPGLYLLLRARGATEVEALLKWRYQCSQPQAES